MIALIEKIKLQGVFSDTLITVGRTVAMLMLATVFLEKEEAMACKTGSKKKSCGAKKTAAKKRVVKKKK